MDMWRKTWFFYHYPNVAILIFPVTPAWVPHSWGTFPFSLLSLMFRVYWEHGGLKSQGVSIYPFIQAFLHPGVSSGMENESKHVWTEKLGKGVLNCTFYFAKFNLWTRTVKATDWLLLSRAFLFRRESQNQISKEEVGKVQLSIQPIRSCYLYEGPGSCQQPFGLDATAHPWAPTQTTRSPPSKSICCSWVGSVFVTGLTISYTPSTRYPWSRGHKDRVTSPPWLHLHEGKDFCLASGFPCLYLTADFRDCLWNVR